MIKIFKNIIIPTVLLIVFYFIARVVLAWFCPEISRYHFLIVAAFTGLMYFIIKGVIKRLGKNAIIPSIQVFLIFSALSTLLPHTGGPHIFLNAFGIFLFYVIAIFPEILGFIGLIWIKKSKQIVGSIFIIIAILTAVEIVPIRMSLCYDETAWIPLSDEYKLMPFGKNDREFEFKRSLSTIENLIIKSKNVPEESLKIVTLYIPDLVKKPDILKLNTTNKELWSEYRYNSSNSVFKKTVLKLNVKLDTDRDGLSDFQEAELLSDPYNQDTDGDGLNDKNDSDPLNPFIESDIGTINAAIIKYWMADNISPLCIVYNLFYYGEGEIANFDKYVILLSENQYILWHIIFDHQYQYGPPDIEFRRYLFNLFRKVATVGVASSGGGGMLLLIKWGDKWRVIALGRPWIS